MKRSNDSSSPVSQDAINVSIMDVLALEWMCIGALHYLIVMEKVTTYIWCRLFGHQKTANSLQMVSDIITDHGCPKLIVSDSGPSFHGEFVTSQQELHIDHTSTVKNKPAGVPGGGSFYE